MPTSFDTITVVFGVAVVLALAGAGIAGWWARQARHEVTRLSEELRSGRSDRAPQEPQQQGDGPLSGAPEWLRESLRPLEDATGKLEADIARLEAEIQRVGGADVAPAEEARPTPTSDAGPRRSDRGRAVDLRDGSIVGSRALAAPAFLVPDHGDKALLYLNEDVEVDHLALERWSEYFDFGAGTAYRRYRTVEPAHVEWNASAERGRLLSPGKAEVL